MEPKELTVSKRAEGGKISIRWSDGHHSIYDPFNLRSACPCAMCKGEPGVFGKYYKSAKMEVQNDVHVEEIKSIGRYGLRIDWTDGHNTGIYSFDYLRSLCECESCLEKSKEQR
ncbi:MAG TPA: DUF971 domain-containing protein [Nitrososphaerales archaeon]|nr:DUF971 domain-containing protein [Nitrososphaerales archaeon]